MKKKLLSYIAFAIIALGGGLLSSCSSDNEPARTPVASVTVDKTNLSINESMEIQFTGVADQVVVFTGDADHEYQDYGSGSTKANTGFVVNKGLFTYSYTVPGTFHVVVVASTYDTYSGGNQQEAKYEFDVTVTDDCTTLDEVYSSITPNVYYAELVGNDNWVLRLPAKQVYKNKEIALNAAKQRISYEIQSDSSKVYVDEVLHSTKSYYDLTKVHTLKVVSYAGTSREYKLYTVIYPEFTTVAIGGVSGVLTRDAYNQDLLTYTFTGAESKAAIEYTVDSGIQLFANGKAVSNGDTVDLSDTSVEYTLVRTHPDNSAVTATSRLVLKK